MNQNFNHMPYAFFAYVRNPWLINQNDQSDHVANVIVSDHDCGTMIYQTCALASVCTVPGVGSALFFE